MHDFEYKLAIVCSKCIYAYGGMGATGYNYDSVKDNLKWEKLSVKKWIRTILDVGFFMTLNKDAWEKSKKDKEDKVTGEADIASALKAAFGDGTKSK